MMSRKGGDYHMLQVRERNDDLYDYLDDWENEPTPCYTKENIHLYYEGFEKFSKECDKNEELQKKIQEIFEKFGY